MPYCKGLEPDFWINSWLAQPEPLVELEPQQLGQLGQLGLAVDTMTQLEPEPELELGYVQFETLGII